MKILVSGATGFIGNNVINFLLSKNIDVIATSRSEIKARKCEWYNSVNYIPFDISNISSIANIFTYFDKPDVLIHLAWDGLPDRGLKNSTLNQQSSEKFLTNLNQISYERLIAVGSCLELEQPDSAFARAKNKVLSDIQSMELNFIWPRVFYSYGYGQHPNSLLNSILDKTNKGQEFSLVNPGVAHDFVSISDVVEGLKKAAESEYIGPVDIGTGKSITVGIFTEEVFKILGLDLNLDAYESKDSLVANVEEAKKCIDWHSKVDLESGLRSALRQKGRIT